MLRTEEEIKEILKVLEELKKEQWDLWKAKHNDQNLEMYKLYVSKISGLEWAIRR